MPETMRAVGFSHSLPVSDPQSLIDLDLPIPEPGPRDLLVRVRAVSVNPVDVKIRAGGDPDAGPKVLGYDAAGIVEAVGGDVTEFEAGEEVFYSGVLKRQCTIAVLHVVDERIAGHKPRSLTFEQAAAMPLTSLTAWETLFDRFRLTRASSGTLVVLAAAGGVGSMVIQLAKALTGLTVIGTASRPESQEWARSMGADHVVNHHDGLAEKALEVAPDGVDYVFTPHSTGNVEAFATMLKAGGEITAIDDPEGLDLIGLKTKSITWHWELMFTRPLFGTPDMSAQHDALEEIARLVDAGTLRTTMNTVLQPFNAETMRQAHELSESGSTIGKIVVTGF